MFYPALLQISWVYDRTIPKVSRGCRVCIGVNDEGEEGGSRTFSLYIIIHPAARIGLKIALYIYRVMGESGDFILYYAFIMHLK